MESWLLGILVCVIIVIIINSISKPVNNGLTEEDYNKMKRDWEEQDLEEQRFDDYIDGEVEMGKEKLGINSNKTCDKLKIISELFSTGE